VRLVLTVRDPIGCLRTLWGPYSTVGLDSMHRALQGPIRARTEPYGAL